MSYRGLLFCFKFYSVYFARELLLRLLYTPVAIRAADIANEANHSTKLLLSPVYGISVPGLVSFVISSVSV